jgi:hypothetical protein
MPHKAQLMLKLAQVAQAAAKGEQQQVWRAAAFRPSSLFLYTSPLVVTSANINHHVVLGCMMFALPASRRAATREQPSADRVMPLTHPSLTCCSPPPPAQTLGSRSRYCPRSQPMSGMASPKDLPVWASSVAPWATSSRGPQSLWRRPSTASTW